MCERVASPVGWREKSRGNVGYTSTYAGGGWMSAGHLQGSGRIQGVHGHVHGDVHALTAELRIRSVQLRVMTCTRT
eukprot:4021318-Pyramimonas_sp.AAC.1